MAKKSSTFERKDTFYPSPQNVVRLKKATTAPDGSKRDGTSKNKIINEALNKYFASILI